MEPLSNGQLKGSVEFVSVAVTRNTPTELKATVGGGVDSVRALLRNLLQDFIPAATELKKVVELNIPHIHTEPRMEVRMLILASFDTRATVALL